MCNENAFVVHSDGRIYLLERKDPKSIISQHLIEFADLVKAPEPIYTFELSPYALWAAAAKEIDSQEIIDFISLHSKNLISEGLKSRIRKEIVDFGTIKLSLEYGGLVLEARAVESIEKIYKHKKFKDLNLLNRLDNKTLLFPLTDRINLKKILFDLDLFAIDTCNRLGEPLNISIRPFDSEGRQIIFRDYQKEAINSYIKYSPTIGGDQGGGGVIIMPPGSGKTLVGLGIIERLKSSCLIFVQNEASAERWQHEIGDKTDLDEDSLLIYSGTESELRPITICTYSRLSKSQAVLSALRTERWGLIIYDDAHKLMAPKSVVAIDIDSQYKLALASTLARADQTGNQVFALIGPKWYEVLPRTLENQGYLVPVTCIEVKVPLDPVSEERYRTEPDKNKSRQLAAVNSQKNAVVERIRKEAIIRDKKVLLVSWYNDSVLSEFERIFQIDGICRTKDPKTSTLVHDFNDGSISMLICTQVVERLPLKLIEILVAVSYQQSSEREEYLRLGKLLQKEGNKEKGIFYSLVSRSTVEEADYAYRRKRLANYGYKYKILTLDDVLEGRLYF